jgi:hypothetical protein
VAEVDKKKVYQILFAAVVTYLKAFASRVLNLLWDDLGALIISGLVIAEQKWVESGMGSLKKQWVLDEVMKYAESKAKLGFIQKTIFKYMLGVFIDAIVDEFNDRMGRDWGVKAEEIKKEWADKLPIIED